MSLARCTFELEVHEAELSEESEEKKRKEKKKKEKKRKEKNRKEKKRKGSSSSVESQNGHVVAHGHVVALEGRACALACASLREACARFRPSFAKIICSPVSGTCLAELSKPCANLALPCSTTAFSWGPATKRKCKTCQRHSNVTLILFCLLYLFGKCPYTMVLVGLHTGKMYSTGDTCHMYTHMLGQFDYEYTNKVYIYDIYIYA